VIGTSFDPRDLASLTQSRDIDDAIDRLVEEGLLEEERESRGGLMSFSSGVVHDVLYAGLSPRKRRSLHRRSAELLETRYAGRLERVLPQLVQHFFQGDVPDKTVGWPAPREVLARNLQRRGRDPLGIDRASPSSTQTGKGPRELEGDARLLLAKASRMTGDLETARRSGRGQQDLRAGKRADTAGRGAPLAADTSRQARQPEAMGSGSKGPRRCPQIGDANVLRQLLSLATTRANLSATTSARTCIWRRGYVGAEGDEASAEDRIPSGAASWWRRRTRSTPSIRSPRKSSKSRRSGNGLRNPADDGYQRPLVAVALREVGPGGSGTPLP
jgi:hypothetical protein